MGSLLPAFIALAGLLGQAASMQEGEASITTTCSKEEGCQRPGNEADESEDWSALQQRDLGVATMPPVPGPSRGGFTAVANGEEWRQMLASRSPSLEVEEDLDDDKRGLVMTVPAVLVTGGKVVGSAILGQMVREAFKYLMDSDSFDHAVGPFGLPITFGVINDTPNDVLYEGYHLLSGRAWGFPALKTTVKPGEMLTWFLYTRGTEVAATMMFQGGDGKSWSIAIGQYRFGNLHTGCDRLRFNAVAGTFMAKAQTGLCKTVGNGNGAGIAVRGGYTLTALLNELEV